MHRHACVPMPRSQRRGKQNADDLVVLNHSIESGAIAAVMDRSYALADTPDAIRALETGHVDGRVTIIV